MVFHLGACQGCLGCLAVQEARDDQVPPSSPLFLEGLETLVFLEDQASLEILLGQVDQAAAQL